MFNYIIAQPFNTADALLPGSVKQLQLKVETFLADKVFIVILIWNIDSELTNLISETVTVKKDKKNCWWYIIYIILYTYLYGYIDGY